MTLCQLLQHIFDTMSSINYNEMKKYLIFLWWELYMEFQRARTKKQIANRQEEIIAACAEIYQKKGYEAVNFKAISKKTSISRPGIYNYYETKEEIFLDILRLDINKWENDFKFHFESINQMTKEEFCTFLADSVVAHEKYLELLAVYMRPIEKNSRLEKLAEFKKATYLFFLIFRKGLDKYFPDIPKEKKSIFIFYSMTIVYGAYPLTHLSEKQVKAMKKAEPEYETPDFREVCYYAFLKILSHHNIFKANGT